MPSIKTALISPHARPPSPSLCKSGPDMPTHYSPLPLFFMNASSPPNFSSISFAFSFVLSLVLGLEMAACSYDQRSGSCDFLSDREGTTRRRRRRRNRDGFYLVPARFVGDILHIAMNVVHWVGHGGDIVLGCAGGGGVVDFVGHVCCAVLCCACLFR